MADTSRKAHLAIIKNRTGKVYGCMRTSFRVDGKPRHETLYTFKDYSEAELKAIKAALEGKPVTTLDDVNFRAGREYGASAALYSLAEEIGLGKTIYSRREDWVKSVLAMIIGRIVYQGSKLSLSNVTEESCLWEICGFDRREIDVDKDCYGPMDKLWERQKAIEKSLAARHFSETTAILYDITSSYFEGEYENCDIVARGYSRDGKKKKKQIVVGLICTKEGCPVSVQVFKGNTQDMTTVDGRIEKLKKDFGVTEMVFVGDRGMINASNFDKYENVKTVSGLTHAEIQRLIDDEVVQLSFFDEKLNVEIISPNEEGVRYALMKNPARAAREDKTLDVLLDKTEAELKKVADYKRKADDAKLNQRLGRAKNKYNIGKCFDCSCVDGKVTYSRKDDKIADERRVHGLYVLRTNAPKESMSIDDVVETYRSLINVEQAFRTLKTTELEMRPVYHRTQKRIETHVFICMLSYYLLWHVRRRLKPLFEEDGAGKNRAYTLDSVIRKLGCIQQLTIDVEGFHAVKIATPTDEQKKIMDLLKVTV